MGVKIALLFLLFLFYSFIGWLWEVIDKVVEEKKLVNRGFLIGPICPIYGCGCLLLLGLLGKYKNDFFILFFMSIVLCSILEYATSYFMEKLFNARWWDYSKQKFNINGRICAETMIPFGIVGSCIVAYVNPFLKGLLLQIPSLVLCIISGVLAFIFVIDIIFSTKVIVRFSKTMQFIEKDATEEISKKVRAVFSSYGILSKRLIEAFPHVLSYTDYLKKIQKRISKEVNKFSIKIGTYTSKK